MLQARCEKAAALKKHEREEPPISEELELRMENGRLVGLAFRELYPGGYDASKGNTLHGQKAIEYTADLVKSGAEIIYEAAFQSPDRLFMFKADVYLPRARRVIEVKSSTSVKDEHIIECGFYEFILSELFTHKHIYTLAHINRDYILEGELDVRRLFIENDITKRVQAQVPMSMKIAYAAQDTARGSTIPDKKVGEQCRHPYDCEHMPECFHTLKGQDSVMNLLGLQFRQKIALLERGKRTMRELPRDLKLNARQQIQVEAHIGEKMVFDRNWLEEFMASISNERLCFLDFETYMLPIPTIQGTHPYQQIPFQYSAHIYNRNTESVEHKEFLAEGEPDPRSRFIESLINDIGDDGLIITYNQAFELARLRELSVAFPNHAEKLRRIMIRIHDLMLPFKQMKLYSPKQRGSYSLKAVLPAFVDKMSYVGRQIQNGNAASAKYLKLLRINAKHRPILRRQLLEYCEMDTAALVAVWQFIHSIVEKEPEIKPSKTNSKNEKSGHLHRPARRIGVPS